jgi:putative transcription factor
MQHPSQDWNPVVWTKKAPTGAKAADPHLVNEARRRGDVVDVEKRRFVSNHSATASIPNARKLEEETEVFRHAHVSHDFRIALQKARQAKAMTQQQLATAICEKVTVVNEYESGKAIPNGAIIQKLNKALGVTLPKAKAKE